MTVQEFKHALAATDKLAFALSNGEAIPKRVHVTELGKVTKHFMDCGGVERTETKASLQLWNGIDLTHRLSPDKLLRIVEAAERKLGLTDEEIEVEYQGETIQKFGLTQSADAFTLTPLSTDCLAKGICDIPAAVKKPFVSLAGMMTGESCAPGSGCC